MPNVRSSVVNDTLDRDHVVAERWGRRPFGERSDPYILDGLYAGKPATIHSASNSARNRRNRADQVETLGRCYLVPFNAD